MDRVEGHQQSPSPKLPESFQLQAVCSLGNQMTPAQDPKQPLARMEK